MASTRKTTERRPAVATMQDAIEALRRMARELPRYFTLEPGATDADLAADPLLPDDVRALLRATTGVRVEEYGEQVAFDPRRTAVDDQWAWGPGDTARVVCRLSTGDTFFVDRDPATGAWGAVFSQSADFFDTWVYCARSLPEFLVDWAAESLANAAAEEEPFQICFPFEDVWNLNRRVEGTPVGRLHDGDTELADVAWGLPEEAVLVDLRDLEPPVKLDMKGEGEFRRCGDRRRFAVTLPE